MDTADPTLNPSCDTTQPGYAIRQFSLVPQAAAAGNYRKFGIVGLHGTSMAAAHVSATAALLLARRPRLSPAQVEGRIEACASLPGQATFYGKGLLDAAKATSTNSC
jgi:subtilisin family serine protease